MDLDELRAFIAVVETGSFSGAAKSLNFARATLRRQVDELEARSGVQLLRRAADGATVTKAGEMLARKGRDILGETRALLSAVRALEAQDDVITMEIPMGQSPEVERKAHATCRKAAPNLRWRIRYSDGSFDPQSDALVVIHFGSAPQGHDAEWHHMRVAKIPCQLVASQEYIDERGRPSTVEELREHPLLVWERHDRDPSKILRVDEGEAVEIEPTLLNPSAYIVRFLASEGDGIALAPNAKFTSFLSQTDDLVPILPDVVGDKMTLWVSTRRDTEAGPFGILVKALTRFLGTAIGTGD